MSRYDNAKEYVDKQLEVMAKYGPKPELSERRYQKLIADVLKALPDPPASGANALASSDGLPTDTVPSQGGRD